MHRLLERQLRRVFGSVEAAATLPAELLTAVDRAYQQADEDRLLLERSLDLTSQELLDRNRQLREDFQKAARAKRERERERRELEEQLRQSQKLEALGQLAGGVAHDFNNLLTAILGYSELLGARMAEDGRQYPEISEISRAGRRAADLTRQLLAFSRRQVFQPGRIQLNAVVSEMEQMLRRLIRADIELVTVLDPALDPVLADPGQIEQVITNLIVNARDAMPAGGKLTIATANVTVDAGFARRHPVLAPGRYVRLQVRDSGEGIDPAHKERLFEPFFTTKEVGAGTGLGLAVVYGIVEQSGGHILVDSAPGVGSTFSVYLPRAERPAGDEARAPEPAPAHEADATILLVEDEAVVRRLTARILTEQGYRILEAAHGRAALEIVTSFSGPIDLLLTDVVMPELPGPALAQQASSLLPAIKVLFMSGYSDVAMAGWEGPLGHLPILQKPFAASELLSRVREALAPAS
jgi:two-component system cell cycle sensor histidine kinase/response regulator CckA